MRRSISRSTAPNSESPTSAITVVPVVSTSRRLIREKTLEDVAGESPGPISTSANGLARGGTGRITSVELVASRTQIDLAGTTADTWSYGPVPAPTIRLTTGDTLRDWKTAGVSAHWKVYSRNKKSLALDMKSAGGLEIAKALIADADVLVENFSSGVMERFGLDHATCLQLNPRLIYCSVSAYGREGAYADRLGFDPIAQAESGFISMNGYDDRQGVRTGSAIMDTATAMSATNAILLALLARAKDGKGQRIEVALYDTAILMTGFGAMQHLTTGHEPRRNGNVSPDTCPSGVFMTADKPVYINCGNDKIFQRLFEQVFERPDVAHDPVLSLRAERLKHREAIFKIIG